MSPTFPCLAATLLLAAGCATNSAAPYAGQQSRDIKSLSEEDVQGYLAGKGMGFAKPAELNGYPGPAHVLEVADRIGLSPEQQVRTEMLFKSMQGRAASLGSQIVEEERALDRLFASRTVTAANLSASLGKIARLQAQVRETHLEAHLAQAAILNASQVEAYARLRGYGAHAH